MWEYAIREYVQEWGEPIEDRSMGSFLEELNRLGEDGWEAVGITPRTHYDRGGGADEQDPDGTLHGLNSSASCRRPAAAASGVPRR